MTSADFIIREIKPTDNIEISKVIKSVILEMGAPKIGTAYEDKATERKSSESKESKSEPKREWENGGTTTTATM